MKESIFDAVERGDLSKMQSMLSAGSSCEVRDAKGRTLLMTAARAGQYACVDALLKRGVDVNAVSESGSEWSALIYAIKQGHLEIVKRLMEAGADIQIKDWDNWTPIMIAAESGELEIFKFLLSSGADIEARTRGQMTVLAVAAEYGNVEMLKLLIEAGADVNVREIYNVTPLMNAVQSGKIDAVRVLLEAGADVTLKTDPATEEIASMTAYDYAMASKNEAIGRLLTDYMKQ